MVANTLPSKAARFVDEYMLDHNGAAAAVRAGYSARSAPVTASRLLRKANVVELLTRKRRGLEAQFSLSQKSVIEKLQSAAEMAEVQGDPTAMVAAYRQIGLMLGYYAEEKRTVAVITASKDDLRALEAMSDEELAALMASGATAASP